MEWPTDTYDIIVIDPPWPLNKTGKRKSRPNQSTKLDYPTMSIDEIKDLKIGELANATCICCLWTIQKFLPCSFDILEHWGFDYKRTLTWHKRDGMCLQGFHHCTEFVLIGTKGSWPTFMKQPAMSTLIEERSKRHSRKPDLFYDKISLFGAKKIDIFARELRAGWDVYGNEV